MAELPIAARAVYFVRDAVGNEQPTHGPGSPIPAGPLLPFVGAPPPVLPPIPPVRAFQANRFAVVVHCPAPVLPMGHAILASQNALVAGVRDLLLETFPDAAKCNLRQFALAHTTSAAFNHLLTSFPPSALPAMALPLAGAVVNLVIGFGCVTETSSFTMDDAWSVYHAAAPARGRSKKVFVDISNVANFGPGASLRVVSLGLVGRGASCPRRGIDPPTEHSHMLVRHVWYDGNVNTLLANCSTAAAVSVENAARVRAAARIGEVPSQRVAKRPREQQTDNALVDAKQAIYDASPPHASGFDSWVQPGIDHVMWALGEKYWHDNMKKTLAAWKREWLLGQPRIKRRRPYKLKDLSLFPQGPQYATFLEVNQRDPIDRRAIIVVGEPHCGKSTLQTQLSLREHTEMYDGFEWAGFVRVETNMLRDSDGLKRVYQALKASPAEVLGINLEKADALTDSQYANLANLTDVYSPGQCSMYEGDQIILYHHLLITTNLQGLAKLIEALRHKQIWLLRMKSWDQPETTWEFPGEQPTHLPYVGSCGGVRNYTPPDCSFRPISGWLRHWMLLSLPAHLPGVPGPLRLDDDAVARDAFVAGMLYMAAMFPGA